MTWRRFGETQQIHFRPQAAVASALSMGHKGDFAPIWLALLPCDGVRPQKSTHRPARGATLERQVLSRSAMESAHSPDSHRPNHSPQGFRYPTRPAAYLLSASLPAGKRCFPQEEWADTKLI